MRPYRHVCTAQEAHRLDLATQTRYGLSGERLMDAAGVAAAQVIRWHHPDPVPVLVLAGPGHNGGDGWVVARVLSQGGYPTSVHPIAGIHPWQKEAVSALGEDIRLTETVSEWPDSGIVVDALFGIGLNRPPDDMASTLIRHLDTLKRPVWSLDVPSGLDATNGIPLGACVKATHTLAMGCWKSGYWAGDGPRMCGRLHIVPLGFPSVELASTKTRVFFADDPAPLTHSAGAHKYASGTVHLIGGSAGMSGAVVMAAKAAWNTGCGSVMVHVPGASLALVDAKLVEPVKFGYGSADQSHFTQPHAAAVLARIRSRPGSVVIGPGLGRHSETERFTRTLLDAIEMPVVVDADALPSTSGMTLPNAVLTPHPGELERLTGTDSTLWTDRRLAANRLSTETGAIVVSKGQPTAVVQPDGQTLMTGYDTRVFSRMGAGDALAGSIGSFLLSGGVSIEAVEAALLHGIRNV